MITAEAPELKALAQMADIDPVKLSLAFNQPDLLFEHITLDELARLASCCNRLTRIQTEMVKAMDAYAVQARDILDGAS